jgi:NADH-quinone oxidoreductase subunit L
VPMPVEQEAHRAPAAPPAHAHGAHAEPHEAPWSMAVPLIILAVGSVLAGYVGVPHALGGDKRIERFLEPSFHGGAPAGGMSGQLTADPAHADEPVHDHARTELMLMALSSGVALAGIGIAAFFWLRNRDAADRVAVRLRPLYQLLLGKYYVDEAYNAALVEPVKRGSIGLWKGFDAEAIMG